MIAETRWVDGVLMTGNAQPVALAAVSDVAASPGARPHLLTSDDPDAGEEMSAPESPPESPTGGSTDRPGRFRNGLEWVAVVGIAVLVALVVKVFIIQAFSIPSESMVPTLEIGDRVLVNKLSYDAHDIHRGDVIVFERPSSLPATPGDPEDLIKRVIGLPGESVETVGGTVYIDGRQLIEPYLSDGTSTDGLDQAVKVPKGHVFVMGDNRGRSRDSRFIGAIDEHLVVGRAFARIWPLSRVGFL